MKKIKIIVLLIMTMMMLADCKKDLDLEADVWYGVREFLLSKNCDTKCGIPAPAEENTVRLEGFIDEFYMMEETRNFYVFDQNNDNFSINVEVDSVISNVIFTRIKNSQSKNAKIKGIIKGFDKPTNFNCERGFYLVLKYESDFIIE